MEVCGAARLWDSHARRHGARGSPDPAARAEALGAGIDQYRPHRLWLFDRLSHDRIVINAARRQLDLDVSPEELTGRPASVEGQAIGADLPCADHAEEQIGLGRLIRLVRRRNGSHLRLPNPSVLGR